ncbi:MAG: hypothetical protein ACHQ1D_04505 [Nitrososphaerales archaeon]
MKSMREMINLMEGVVAIPGLKEGGPKPYEIPAYKRKEQGQKPLTPKDVQDQEKEGKLSDRENLKKAGKELEEDEELDEKSKSEKQARFMAACAHGADYASCPDDKVSKEFNKADTGTKQLSNAMKESHVSQGQMSNPGVARDILAMENDIADIGFGESDDYTDWTMKQGEMGSAAKGLDPTADNPNIERAIEMYQNYTSSFVDPQEAFDLVLRNFDEEGLDAAEIDEIAAAISKLQYGDPHEDDPDYTDWSMRQGEMGLEELAGDPFGGEGGGDDDHYNMNRYYDNCVDFFGMFEQDDFDRYEGEDEDYGVPGKEVRGYMTDNDGKEFLAMKFMFDGKTSSNGNPSGWGWYDDSPVSGISPMEEDLQNGYNDQYYASGNDYFPNGADGPVVRSVGPSGARHGDNPEQKYMKTEIEEVHKELVYGYRSFLKEAKSKLPDYNRYGHYGAAGSAIDSDQHKQWAKEEARLKKKREADAAKAKTKKKIK